MPRRSNSCSLCKELFYFIGLSGIIIGLPTMKVEGERERDFFQGPKNVNKQMGPWLAKNKMRETREASLERAIE